MFPSKAISASKDVSKGYCSPGDTMDPADVLRNNQNVVAECEKGELIQFPRENLGGLSHWAVYVGRGKVIHLTGESAETAKVKEDRFWDVVGGSVAKINNSLDDVKVALPKAEIVDRARSKLGTTGYDAESYNCEHFATWCRYGEAQSLQVIGIKVTVVGAVAAVASAALAGAAAVISH